MFGELFKVFEAADESLFFVGGFVRDKLMGLEPNDVDFATSARPEKTIEILRKNKFKAVPIGIEFGTVQTFVDGQKVEITTFRRDEAYRKGDRKPAVIFGDNIEDDLRRRDFTMNAVAMRQDGFLIDLFGGVHDASSRHLKTPIGAMDSISDDPLRMLRACRFHTKFGGTVNWLLFDAMIKLAHKIREISKERVFEEMSKLLMTKDPTSGLELMVESGLMRHLFPEIQSLVDFKQNQGEWHSKLVWPHTLEVVRNSPAILSLRWSAFVHDVAKPETYEETEDGVHFIGHEWKGALIWDRIAKRLRVSKNFQKHVHFLVREHLQLSALAGAPVLTDRAIRRFVHRVGDKMNDLILLSMADITSKRPDRVAKMKGRIAELKERIEKLLLEDSIPKIALPKGTGLVVAEALGIKPGPQLGEVMSKLKQMLIDGEATMDSDFGKIAKEMQDG
jgi:poly(A) polymerase